MPDKKSLTMMLNKHNSYQQDLNLQMCCHHSKKERNYYMLCLLFKYHFKRNRGYYCDKFHAELKNIIDNHAAKPD